VPADQLLAQMEIQRSEGIEPARDYVRCSSRHACLRPAGSLVCEADPRGTGPAIRGLVTDAQCAARRRPGDQEKADCVGRTCQSSSSAQRRSNSTTAYFACLLQSSNPSSIDQCSTRDQTSASTQRCGQTHCLKGSNAGIKRLTSFG
jgi:hypothetical protein